MKSRTKARATVPRAPLLAILTLAVGPAALGSVQQPTPPAALLSGSAISVTESGGIAGRVHSTRLTASSGRVDVEYRAREAPVSAPPLTGSLPAERYVALWRDLEAADVWNTQSSKPSRGADLIATELRIRLGDTSRVIRWDDGVEVTPEIRRLSDIARRVLSAGRESAFTR